MNIGLDIGYSAIKSIGNGRRVTFPSVVGTPDRARFSLDGPGSSIILLEPDEVLVGAGAVLQSRHLKRREDRRWTESDEWMHLALAAFTELTSATSVELRIVTGLPVAFYSDKDKVRDRLLGEHKVRRENRKAQSLKVVDVRVIPQPFGALLAEALDDRGRIANQDLATGNIGVIDIGGKTTNLLSVHRLSEIGRETSSVSVGAWGVMRAVQRRLLDNYPDLELRDHQVMDAMLGRQTRYYGDVVDLSAIVEGALAPMAEQVIAEATQLWDSAAGLDEILVTGGGALLMGPVIQEHFRHARIVEEPVWANALGFWRFAKWLEK